MYSSEVLSHSLQRQMPRWSPVGWLWVILPSSVPTSTKLFSLSGCQYLIPTHIALAAAPNPDPEHKQTHTHVKKKRSNAGLQLEVCWLSSTFFIERCVPGKQEVVRLEVDAALHCCRIGDPALEGRHGFNIEAHQLPVQVLQAPVVWIHTPRVIHDRHATQDEWCSSRLSLASAWPATDQGQHACRATAVTSTHSERSTGMQNPACVTSAKRFCDTRRLFGRLQKKNPQNLMKGFYWNEWNPDSEGSLTYGMSPGKWQYGRKWPVFGGLHSPSTFSWFMYWGELLSHIFVCENQVSC